MMPVYETIYNWAKKTTTSFAELRFSLSQRDVLESDYDSNAMIYRLKRWPDLPTHARTANVLRALSMMSTRPVNRHWLLAHSKLQTHQVDQLLQRLVAQGAVEVVDGSKYGPSN